MICSGGWGDGQVQCVDRQGAPRASLDTGTWSISTTAATPDHRSLVVGAVDGRIWWFDGVFQALYAHSASVQSAAVSADLRLLASCARDGSVTVFDLVCHQTIASRFGHVGQFCSVSWTRNELWSSGDEGTLKRWTVTDRDLTIAHMVLVSSSLRMLKLLRGGWAAVEGTSTLLVSRDGAAIALRIDAGRRITAIDISADQQYIAASLDGEIIAIDLARNAIATQWTGAPIQDIRFLEPDLLGFSEPAALKTLRVDQLAFVPFEAVPEPPNRVSF